MVEIEGAFVIGMISAINYLGLSRLLELVRVDDMVSKRNLKERYLAAQGETGASFQLGYRNPRVGGGFRGKDRRAYPLYVLTTPH